EGRLGMRLFQVLEDGDRLRQRAAVVELQEGDLPHGVLFAVLVPVLVAALADEVDRDVLEGKVLVGESGADPPARAAPPVVVEPHGFTTLCWMRPKRLLPCRSSISISTVSPTFMKGVRGAPVSMVSIIRRSARHEMPRARSSLETVPLPRIVPAVKLLVLQMCSIRSKKEKCISGPASGSPTSSPL